MDIAFIKNIIIQVINEKKNIELSEDILEKNISSLEIDSLDFFNIVIEIENKLDVEFDEKIYRINTINELINLAYEIKKEQF